jgi:nucleotide-binding universal stress UspA family protein
LAVNTLTEISDAGVTHTYKKILVPLDGSELAEQSLKHALAIIKSDKPATIVLFAVVEPINPVFLCAPGSGRSVIDGVLLEELLEKKQKESREYLAGLLTRLKSKGVELQSALTIGRASEAIVKFAESNNIDLIIMSTHGRSGINRWVMGSVTEQVMRSSRVPVLVIPPQQS